MISRYMLLIKMLTLVVLILVILIPLTLIKRVITEREYYQDVVIQSIVESSSDLQTIIGPIIVVPYIEKKLDKENNQKYEVSKVHYILPQTLDVNADADISSRHLGIYQAQIYQSELKFNGTFIADSLKELKDNTQIKIQSPYLIVLISDTRGIMQVPLMTLNEQKINFEPGVRQNGIAKSSGINIPLSLQQITETNLDFNFSLHLQGTKELSVVPIARSTNYKLVGNWPNPNFLGYTLPVNRQINETGFTATWKSSWYSNNINNAFSRDIDLDNNYSICYYHSNISSCFPSFKTSFVETVDQYQMTERAVKYAVLIIVLIFVSFFMFEILKQFKIHPIQYLLVSMALAIFYLLLLALSEYIGFLLSYICGVVACSLLIGFYLSSVLHSIKWSSIFTLYLLSLYTALYFVMVSEVNALLLGSILLFIVLAGIMILTRKVDWYSIAQLNVKKQDPSD